MSKINLSELMDRIVIYRVVRLFYFRIDFTPASDSAVGMAAVSMKTGEPPVTQARRLSHT